MSYEKTYQVRWADLDPNAHMKSVAYLEYATHTRFAFLHENGFGIGYLQGQRIGPILFEEKVNFYKECAPQEPFSVSNVVVSLGEDGRKWHMKHEFKNADGALCAVVSAKGAWFSLAERKVIAPPRAIFELLSTLPQGTAVQ
jgi:acyl-CoA thioester hydrolase